MTYLDKMIPGQKGKVVGFRSDGPVVRRLTELGLAPGRRVEYVRDAPLRDPLEIEVNGSYLSIRHSEASLVAIELEE